jgi:hypothetical protein
MRAGIFLGSANSSKFVSMLYDFSFGIMREDDQVFVTNSVTYEPCDVAVFFGSWKDRNSTWHKTKNNIVSNNKPFICIETPLIGRGPVSDILEDDWYRIGVNGFLADTGNFNNVDKPSDRWEMISKQLKVNLKPWKKEGEYIVVALQLPGDASLRGTPIDKWAADVVAELRKHTNMHIVVRTPQLPREYDAYQIKRITDVGGVSIQQGTKDNLIPTLDRAYATVTFSSGFGIDSVINGVPTIAMDPGSFAYELGNNKIENINNLKYPDRQQWLNNLAYAQWSGEEIKEGLPWKHLKDII